MLSQKERDLYEQEGVLVLPGFVSRQSCQALRQRAHAIVEAFDPEAERTVFSTKTQGHARDQAFFASASQVRCFLEEAATDGAGRLICDKHLAVNKIGHAQHDRDPVFAAFSRTPELAELVSDLGYIEPLLLQSMYIFKSPGTGGEVTCHQDATYLYTQPSTVTGLWFALGDATLENGCLWALKGAHKQGLKSRFVRGPNGMETVVLDNRPFDLAGLTPLPVSEGTLVVLHGLLPHLSHENRSLKPRPAYTLHLIEGAAPVSYPQDNWLLRPPDFPFRGF